ncbi:MAG TPA: iron uptake transporter permease EfeU [Micromonosporaceae bacterium]
MSGALLGQYLIGLREGLEATLVVTILVAFLVKSGRRERLGQVWLGVGAAVVLSVGFGFVLTYVAEDLLSHEQQEFFDAVTSILAVAFVTWMIFWMRRFSRRLATDLRGRLEQAIGLGGLAVVAMAFLAVAREGLETALLFYAAAQGATSSVNQLTGITLGVVTAVALGFLIYAGAVRINLATFFRWTGLALVLVAAGIFKYGVHDLQESGILPGTRTYAFDLSAHYDQSTWYGALLSGMLNFTATPTVFETIAWAAYGLPVLVLFLLPGRRRPTVAASTGAPPSASTTADAPATP